MNKNFPTNQAPFIATRRAMSRRRFLQGAGVALSLPMLDTMLPPFSRAANAPSPLLPGAKPRRMFFPHLATGHKGILNAVATDQAVPLKMTLPGAGASSVTLVLWGSTGCPAVVEAFDQDGKLLDKKSAEAIPGRKAPDEPVPFATLTVQSAGIAYVHLSGPRNGEYLAADEVRFVPSAKGQK